VWLGESGGKRRRGWLAAGLTLTLLAATTTLFLYTYASTVAVATYVAQAQVGYLTQGVVGGCPRRGVRWAAATASAKRDLPHPEAVGQLPPRSGAQMCVGTTVRIGGDI